MKNSKWFRLLCVLIPLTTAGCGVELEEEKVVLGKYTQPSSDNAVGTKVVDIGDSTFNNGSAGLWVAGGSAQLMTEQNIVHAGNYSLSVSGRSAPEEGATISLGEQLIPGNSYVTTAWIRLAGNSGDLTDTTKLVIRFADDNGDNTIIVAEKAVVDAYWIKVTGKYIHNPVGAVTTAPTFSIEGPIATQDYYIDTVTVTDIGNEADDGGVVSINVDMSSGWRASGGLSVEYSDDGVSYQPTAADQQLVFDMAGPFDLSAAEIIFTYKVDQAYLDSGSDLQPFAQAKQGSWTGWWSCYIGNGGMPEADSEGTYTCVLDNADFDLLDDTMGIQIGFQAKGGSLSGKVTATSVVINVVTESNDISADMATGWRASGGLAVDYSADGVSYLPTAADQQLVYDIAGPADLSVAEIVYVLQVDQAFIDSGSDVQPLIQAKQGNWSGWWSCYIGNGDLPAAGVDGTFTCAIELEDFNLSDDTMGMQIGIQVKGGAIAGKVTIKSMDIIIPD